MAVFEPDFVTYKGYTFTKGSRVRRNPKTWADYDQDCDIDTGIPGTGIIEYLIGRIGCRVHWDNGQYGSYEFGRLIPVSIYKCKLYESCFYYGNCRCNKEESMKDIPDGYSEYEVI